MSKDEGRVSGYDVIRGFSVISMVAFHACYDLVYLYGVGLSWFKPPLQDVWRASISWVFLLVAGIMCSYSRSNLRRAAKYLGVALAIWVVTSIAALDTPINFGIIYCMGASTALFCVVERAKILPNKPGGLLAVAAVLGLLFLVCLDVPNGTFGLKAFGGPFADVPRAPYESGLLSWLGFPGPHFASGDYYAPLPFSLLFLAGSCLGLAMKKVGAPKILKGLKCRTLEWVGRHAIEVYIVHQPVVLMLCQAFIGA